MLDIMFEIPSAPNVKECVITEEVITKHARPQLVLGNKEPKNGDAKKSNGDSAESA